MKYRSLILVVLFPLIAPVGFGQSAGGVVAPTVRGGGGIMVNGITSVPGRFLGPAVTGAPYSAEETQEHTQTLNDGTHITQPVMRRMMYRDSLGRTRDERPMMMAFRGDAPPAPIIVEIADPVAGVQYTLDTQNKTARRVTVQTQPAGGRAGAFFAVTSNGAWVAETLSAGPVPPPPPPPPSARVVLSANRRPQVTTEKLGTETIEGVVADGERQTFTIPEGEQGNDRPFNVTTETWTSPELKMVVLRKSSDPRSGDDIMKLTNISRTEPDASLFQPPPDYTIVDGN